MTSLLWFSAALFLIGLTALVVAYVLPSHTQYVETIQAIAIGFAIGMFVFAVILLLLNDRQIRDGVTLLETYH